MYDVEIRVLSHILDDIAADFDVRNGPVVLPEEAFVLAEQLLALLLVKPFESQSDRVAVAKTYAEQQAILARTAAS